MNTTTGTAYNPKLGLKQYGYAVTVPLMALIRLYGCYTVFVEILLDRRLSEDSQRYGHDSECIRGYGQMLY